MHQRFPDGVFLPQAVWKRAIAPLPKVIKTPNPIILLS
ncbi:hypothetical protein MC7420_7235 [Coleofasciculus chthonoplastes PCC 7420]|uniref:Uncharacterized protein n=1 Tax=Coleofasciculus chthonoplastes PCC 7420 TaxID=118168 RepID=B4VHP5_9CYAN|nr:hypothetical protein MC7420_7235 [Coleofasciculus chthonoplastes PCC 7420]